jgi:hypothetical protein
MGSDFQQVSRTYLTLSLPEWFGRRVTAVATFIRSQAGRIVEDYPLRRVGQ